MAASVLAIHMMYAELHTDVETEIVQVDTVLTWQGDTAYKISVGCGQVCGDRPIRVQGGLRYVIATYCIGEYGDYELNTGHLLEDQYNELIQPMKDEVINEARRQGVDLWWK